MLVSSDVVLFLKPYDHCKIINTNNYVAFRKMQVSFLNLKENYVQSAVI